MLWEENRSIKKILQQIVQKVNGAKQPDKWMVCREFSEETGKTARQFELMRNNPRYAHLFANFAKEGAKRALWKINYTQYMITENAIAA